MSSPAPPKPGPDPTNLPDPQAADELPPDPDAPPPVPPEEEFWEKFNRRFEFPFSTVGAVLLHVGIAFLIVVLLTKMKDKSPDKNLPVVISPVSGLDVLDGAPGAGEGDGQDKPEEKFETPPIPPDDLQKLPDVRDTIKDVLPDPNGQSIPDHKLADFANIDKDLAKRLARGDGTRGTGPGGLGTNSAAAQSFRWTLRFRTRSGRDYVYQLGILQAKILVPLPPDNKRCMLFENLAGDPPKGRIIEATGPEIAQLSGQVRFSDRDRDSVRQVAGALGIDETPKIFYAFFPGELRLELADKEKAFAGADLKDIEETIITMNVGGGKYDARVIEQKLRGGKVIRK